MNLFLISGLGQLYHAQSLITQKDFKGNCLAILYTEKNMEILRQIEENLNTELFESVKYVKLPNFPLKINRKKLMEIKGVYADLLIEVKPACLFVCSYEHHYNLILEMAREQKIKIILLEEGTATYKDLIFNEWSRWESIREATVLFIKEICNSIIKLVSSFFSEKEKRFIRKLLIGSEFKIVFNKYKEFDEIYAVFPDKAKMIFNAEHYHEFHNDYKVTQEIHKLLMENEAIGGIDQNSVIFVNQRYNIPIDVHMETIIGFLKKHFPDKHLFLKFHPKDSKEAKNEIITLIETKKYPVKVIDTEYEIPIEAIINFRKPEYLVGITSSSLAYIKKNANDVKILSCADYYLSQVSKNVQVKKQVLEEIKYHKKILLSLCDIEIL